MTDENPKTWKEGVEHPSEDDLLCFIDGELSTRSADGVRLHLEACWHCRNRAEKFQSAISTFVDYRSHVLQPMTDAPGSWSGFGSKLRNQAAELAPPTVWQRLRTSIHRFSVRLPRVEPRTARLTAISAFTVLLATVGFYFVLVAPPTIVSAEELINLASASREKELRSADQPVLYQQLRVTRRNAKGENVANVEIWQDVENLRLRQVVVPGQDQSSPPARGGVDAASADGVVGALSDLEQILRANTYEPPPMSITNFRAWRAGLVAKQDSVEETTHEGVAALRLQTETKNASNPGQIISSTLLLRAADYHPIEQHFRVTTTDGEQTYEIRETSFAVMSLNSLNPGFFADSIPMIVSAKPQSSQRASPDDETANTNTAVTANTNTNTATPATLATAALEVEVIDLLNNAGAFMGEQVTVQRTSAGQIQVNALVETDKRKAELLNALTKVRGNSAVRINIETVAEAQAREAKKRKGNTSGGVTSVDMVQATENSSPVYEDLRRKLSETEARAFADRVIRHAAQASRHALAMKQLSDRFSIADLQSLNTEERAKWLGLLRGHAGKFLSEAESLRRDLGTVFPDLGGGSTAGTPGGDREIQASVRRLYELAVSTDEDLRGSFAVFANASGSAEVKTAKFWRSFNSSIAVARSLQSAR